jgi:hypothetical protein
LGRACNFLPMLAKGLTARRRQFSGRDIGRRVGALKRLPESVLTPAELVLFDS